MGEEGAAAAAEADRWPLGAEVTIRTVFGEVRGRAGRTVGRGSRGSAADEARIDRRAACVMRRVFFVRRDPPPPSPSPPTLPGGWCAQEVSGTVFAYDPATQSLVLKQPGTHGGVSNLRLYAAAAIQVRRGGGCRACACHAHARHACGCAAAAATAAAAARHLVRARRIVPALPLTAPPHLPTRPRPPPGGRQQRAARGAARPLPTARRHGARAPAGGEGAAGAQAAASRGAASRGPFPPARAHARALKGVGAGRRQ